MIKIKYEKFPAFLTFLQKEYTVYAPVQQGTETGFLPVEDESQIVKNIHNTTLNPKNIFFPQAEVMFTYDKNGIHTPPAPGKPIAVWGLRSCDTKSIRMLDEVFGNAHQMPEKEMYKDNYWIDKYKNSILFTTACNDPLSTCFCNWFNSGPFDSEGSDVFVIDTGDSYLMEGISDQGKTLLADYQAAKADDSDLNKIKELKEKAEAVMGKPVELKDLKSKLDKIWDDPLWDEIAAKCINCGACAYICPTCHCFDVSDEGKQDKGQRVRLWDCCMFGLFTKEASGHNPRELSTNRVRQRVMHKYNYFVDNYNEFLCTGCGRCVQVCPVNLDIRKVIKEIIAHDNSKAKG
jgi:ferredoxin